MLAKVGFFFIRPKQIEMTVQLTSRVVLAPTLLMVASLVVLSQWEKNVAIKCFADLARNSYNQVHHIAL